MRYLFVIRDWWKITLFVEAGKVGTAVALSERRREDVPLTQLSSSTMDDASVGKAKLFFNKVD